MLTTFSIKNFRSFRELSLGSDDNPLRRINLIAGKNNTGKTALLEAIFLHLGPAVPTLPMSINEFRGIDEVHSDPLSVWGWLFHRRRVESPIELDSTDDESVGRSLAIRLAEMADESVIESKTNGGATSPPATGSLMTERRLRDLVLEYHDTTNQSGTTRISLLVDRLGIKVAKLRPLPMAAFLGTHVRTPKEDAVLFSRVEQVGRQAELIGTLRIIEPRLKRLAILIADSVPRIHADVGIGQLVPVTYMGEGFGRLLSVVLSIANASDGWVLVDEIENGVHYSVMPDIWRAIGQAARDHDVQVFATTHSWECMRAAHEAFSAEEDHETGYDFTYHRLDRAGDTIVAKAFDREMLETAEATGLEVR